MAAQAGDPRDMESSKGAVDRGGPKVCLDPGRLTFGRVSGAVGGRLPDGTVDSLGCHQGQGDEERRSIAGHPLQRPGQPSSLGGMDSPPGSEVLGLQAAGPESFAQGRLDSSPGSFKETVIANTNTLNWVGAELSLKLAHRAPLGGQAERGGRSPLQAGQRWSTAWFRGIQVRVMNEAWMLDSRLPPPAMHPELWGKAPAALRRLVRTCALRKSAKADGEHGDCKGF